jgi:exodeoxyribonuclease-5
MMITRSNKRANEFNQQIRIRIKDQESSISSGDYLMVVKNNYFWLDETTPAGFIANGDIAEVMRIGKHEMLYDFAFVEATIRMIDYPQMPTFDVKILTETIYSESPALTKAENRKLYDNVMADYLEESSQRKRMELLKKNPYFNALQVKFANAVTCHKSQGGQWPVVFVDQGYLTEEMVDREYIRWLYTAVSRATQKLFLVNFHPRFFDEEESFD